MYANAPIISAKCRFERLGHGVSSEVVVRSIYPVLEVIAVFFAFAAAWFWFRSSQSFAVDVNNLDTLASIKPWLLDVAHYNRMAALCAAIAAVAEGTKVLAIRAGLF
jgi:hypothetical protein